jgi:hypothetical protein
LALPSWSVLDCSSNSVLFLHMGAGSPALS